MSIQDHRNKLKQLMPKIINDVVDTAVEKLIDASPVWTGEFIEGMKPEETPRGYPRRPSKIIIPASERPDFGAYLPPKHESPEALRASVKSGLKKDAKHIMEKKGEVSINNTAGHAALVEYIGWVPSGGKTPPFFPFAQTIGSITSRKSSILRNTKHKVFKK